LYIRNPLYKKIHIYKKKKRRYKLMKKGPLSSRFIMHSNPGPTSFSFLNFDHHTSLINLLGDAKVDFVMGDLLFESLGLHQGVQ
ncbi:hypothetical protein KI387_005797, partial [Taxus chinensis]